jgi:hypothetical protein
VQAVPAPPAKSALDETIRIRLNPTRRTSWQAAAQRDHRTLSDWIRMRCEGLPATTPLPPLTTQDLRSTAPARRIQPPATAGLVQCRYCDQGFRRVAGVHVGSQRLGMIPATPCDRVFATRGGGNHEARPWLAYVDGHALHKKGGAPRRFGSAALALAAATRAAPRRWSP